MKRNWFKRHKVWTFVIGYFCLAFLVGGVGEAVLGELDAYYVGKVAGVVYLPSLLIFVLILRWRNS